MFDLTKPIRGCVLNQGRYLFLEGDMKYKDSVSKVRKIQFQLEKALRRSANNFFRE